MPYKVGDKIVLIRNEKRMTPSAISAIDTLPDRVATIKAIGCDYCSIQRYHMEEIDYNWKESDIECLATERPEPKEVDDPIDDRNEILDLRKE